MPPKKVVKKVKVVGGGRKGLGGRIAQAPVKAKAKSVLFAELQEEEEVESIEGEEADEYEETSGDEEADEASQGMPDKSKSGLRKDRSSTDSLEDDAGSGSSGSGGSRSEDPLCPSGEYDSSSSEDLAPSVSSMTMNIPEPEVNACAALEDMGGILTKAAIRKCHGLDDEDESDVEEESTQKDAPDFNFMTSYEEYLDHYVTSKDLYYFGSDDVARTITTLGFRVPELLTRDQFAVVMKDIQGKRFAKRKDDIHIAYGIPATEMTCPLMQALAEREIQNRTGNMACLIYIRIVNHKDQEVSGWIDFKLRLTKDGTDLWEDYFTGKRKLIPRPSDLCYYNWTTFQVRYNSSDNYLVATDILEGLQFMNKLDMKLITVNPKVRPGDNTNLVKISSPNYLDAGIYDHFLRVKA